MDERRDQLAATLAVALAALALLILLGGRVLGPADLYFKDQPKTVSYTADMLLNGRWALPRDVLHQPATKPPLYNWIGAAAVAVTRSWSPFVLKLPSLLGALLAVGSVFAATRFLLRRPDAAAAAADAASVDDDAFPLDPQLSLRREDDRDANPAGFATAVAAVAAAMCLCNATAADLAYRARPDMLQAGFMTLAFACATMCVWPFEKPKRATWLAMAFWVAVSLAALTKGPMAILPAVYGLILPFVLGRPRDVLRLKPLIGVPIAIVPFGAWFFFAYRQDAGFVTDVLLKGEAYGRIMQATPEGHVKQWWYGYVWWWGKAFVWSNVAIVTACVMLARLLTRRSRLSHPIVPAMLYTLVILAGISLSAGKRIDYVLPAMLPGAIVASFGLFAAAGWVARRMPTFLQPLARAGPAGLVLLYAGVVVYGFWTDGDKRVEVATGWTDSAWQFSREVDAVVGDDPLLVIVRGKTPLPTFLGRHYGDGITDADFAASAWLILEKQPDLPAVLESDPLPNDFAPGDKSKTAVHALYRRSDVPEAVFKAMRFRALDWNDAENVYRRDEHFPPNWRER